MQNYLQHTHTKYLGKIGFSILQIQEYGKCWSGSGCTSIMEGRQIRVFKKASQRKLSLNQAKYTKYVLTDGLNCMSKSPRISNVSGHTGTNEPPKRRNSMIETE